jgi:hypothetical protein
MSKGIRRNGRERERVKGQGRRKEKEISKGTRRNGSERK